MQLTNIISCIHTFFCIIRDNGNTVINWNRCNDLERDVTFLNLSQYAFSEKKYYRISVHSYTQRQRVSIVTSGYIHFTFISIVVNQFKKTGHLHICRRTRNEHATGQLKEPDGIVQDHNVESQLIAKLSCRDFE